MSNLTHKQEVGSLGEKLASDYLIGKGFKLISKNYRQKCGEIDLIMTIRGDLRFIEVKTVTIKPKSYVIRETSDNYEPEDNIHPWKLKRLARTIEMYLMDKDVSEDIDWQLDAVTVYLDENQKLIKIEHLEDIF